MSQDITPFGNNESPFDKKRQQDEDGEFWNGRDLQTLLGYQTWERFCDAIDRAKVACTNSGQEAEINFRGTAKNKTAETRGREGSDYRLTRYACYLIAMNGDPRKDEIAKAQTYFAIKTREAEMGISMPTNLLEALELAVITERARMEAEQRAQIALVQVQELSPKAEEYDEYVDSKGLHTLAEAAQILHNTKGQPIGQKRLIARLRDLEVLCKPVGSESPRPRQEYLELGWFECHPITYKRGNRNVPYMQTFVTPLGITGIFKKLHKNGEDVVEPVLNA